MEGRDTIGRFAKGNQIAVGHDGSNAGRPPKATEEAYLRALLEAVPPEVFAELVKAVAGEAADGDVPAFKVIAEYAIGKPMQHTEAQDSGYPMTLEEFQAEMAKRINQVGELEE